MPKYMLLLYDNRANWTDVSPDEMAIEDAVARRPSYWQARVAAGTRPP